MSRRSLHVLLVARWYPSHDQPGRGSFVADLAAALMATGDASVTVASFDPTHVRGVAASRPERAAQAGRILAGSVSAKAALNEPVSWGVAGLPVARLPVILDGDRRRPEDIADAHGQPLAEFVRAEHARHPIDVIHAHAGLPDGMAALQVADEMDLPLLVTEHASTTADDLVDDEARRLYQRLVAAPRRVVAVSGALAHDIARALGVSENVISVLPNAVPVDEFPEGSAEERVAGELLYVGSRKPSKGVDTLLRAVAGIRVRHPEMRLRLIGSPGAAADEARWHALTAELGIGGITSFEPPAPRAAVAAAMRRATMFVHPSPHETFGMVAAEALASGLPVAATPSGGVDEIVGHDGRFGAIATALSVPALADAIERALAAAPRIDRAAMRAHVVTNYAAPAVAARTMEAYDALMVQTRSRPQTGSGSRVAPRGVVTGTTREPGERTAGPFRLPLILALARGQAVERVALLPAPLRDRLTIVTSPRGRYADDRDLPPWATWLELDRERFYRDAVADIETHAQAAQGIGRLKSLLGGPNLDRMRRDLAARRDDVQREGTRRFIEEAADRVAGVGRPLAEGPPLWLVALDADDFVFAEALGAGIGRIAPGGLRWLADAWDAAGRPG